MTELTAHAFRPVGPADAFPEGSAVPVYLSDRRVRISVVRAGGRICAFAGLGTCAGRPCPLSGGLLTGTRIMCQCHGSEFDITTGTVLRGPAERPLQVYKTQVTEGSIGIRV
jgi:3-phenylpropionate/trans-cinnamate dioxygenase ferredoxin component